MKEGNQFKVKPMATILNVNKQRPDNRKNLILMIYRWKMDKGRRQKEQSKERTNKSRKIDSEKS